MTFPARLLVPVLLGAALSLRAAAGPGQQTVVDSDQFASQSTDRETTSFFTGHVVVDPVSGETVRATIVNSEPTTSYDHP